MRRPPRPGETIVLRPRGFDRIVEARVVKHAGPWIVFGLFVTKAYVRTAGSYRRIDGQPRNKPRLVWKPMWRVHRFDEGRTWACSMNTIEVRAILAAEALR